MVVDDLQIRLKESIGLDHAVHFRLRVTAKPSSSTIIGPSSLLAFELFNRHWVVHSPWSLTSQLTLLEAGKYWRLFGLKEGNQHHNECIGG